MRAFLIEFLKQLETALPPPPHCQHSISYARYGSDDQGWDDKLALNINDGGMFDVLLFDDDDFSGTPAQLVKAVLLQKGMPREL